VNIKKRVTHPYKNWLLKGRFGGSHQPDETKKKNVILGRMVGIHRDEILLKIENAFNKMLTNPDMALYMRNVKDISIYGGLMLKAFYDEFLLKHNKEPYIKGPRDKKMKAVLKHLKIKGYSEVNVDNYPDIKCWQILDWDNKTEVEFSKLLATKIIPECWKGSHTISKHSANIASSVAEAILNCKEHAYTSAKEDSIFKKFYLGVGEYPDEKHRFSFCVYDKGIGIKARLLANPKTWFGENFIDKTRTDSQIIEMATQGKRVATEDGRGEGLKHAVETLAENNGRIDIYSERGYFTSANNNRGGKDMDACLEGTMVAFSFPIMYSEDNE
jgi:hypothetical protein